MSQIDTALIYAAGRGKRMGALTDNTPKPLLEVGGKPLIEYAIAMVRQAGVSNIHVNAAYLAEQIGDYFAGTDITVHYEPDGPYETGGTLKNLSAKLPDAILTLNSDVIFFGENPIPKLMENWESYGDVDALLSLLPRQWAIGHAGHGDFFWDGNRLERRGQAESAPFIYSSVQIIRPSAANLIDERIFSTNLIWDKLIEQSRIGAYICEGKWMDFGNAHSIERARDELEMI